jgi:hypothetical protein
VNIDTTIRLTLSLIQGRIVARIRKIFFTEDGRIDHKCGLTQDGEWVHVAEGAAYPAECFFHSGDPYDAIWFQWQQITPGKRECIFLGWNFEVFNPEASERRFYILRINSAGCTEHMILRNSFASCERWAKKFLLVRFARMVCYGNDRGTNRVFPKNTKNRYPETFPSHWRPLLEFRT